MELTSKVIYPKYYKKSNEFCTFIGLGLIGLEFFSHVFQDPVEVDGEWNKFLGKLDYGFTCIFAIEVLLKVRLICII